MSISSSELKLINDYNQLLKNLFSEYYISPNGAIFGDVVEGMDMGVHFCISKSVNAIRDLLSLDNEILTLKSAPIFNVIKNDKKMIEDLRIKDNQVYFYIPGQDPDDIQYIGSIQPQSQDHTKAAEALSFQVTNQKALYPMDEVNIEDIVAGEVIEYSKDEYSIKLCKKILPLIKKDSVLKVSFSPAQHNDELFNCFILVENKEMDIYHNYLCVKVPS